MSVESSSKCALGKSSGSLPVFSADTSVCLDLLLTNSYCDVSVYKTLKSSRNLCLPNWAGRSMIGTSRPHFQTFTLKAYREKDICCYEQCFFFLIKVLHGVLLVICSVRKLNCFKNKIWSRISPLYWEKQQENKRGEHFNYILHSQHKIGDICLQSSLPMYVPQCLFKLVHKTVYMLNW